MTAIENPQTAPLRVWYLEGIGDDAHARRRVLAPFPFQVGRDRAAGFWLPRKGISKLHSEFNLKDGQLTLRDLGSHNGTFVNAERLDREAVLEPGDFVHFANIGFRVDAWTESDTSSTATPLQAALDVEIKERRRAEEALWNKEVLWRSLFEGALDAVILIDITGRIHFFNPAAERLFGYRQAEISGRNVSLLMPSPHREQHDSYIAAYLKSGTSKLARGRELMAVRQDGSSFPIQLSLSEVLLADRRLFAGIIRDTSDEKVAAESLRIAKKAAEQANQAKSEFLANMSHEIRTPMSAILGYADLLLAEEGIDRAPAHRVEAFRTIQRNGEHLLQVINDILDLSKVEAGKLVLERIRCSPNEILLDVQRIVKQRAQAKSLPFQIEFVGAVPETIETDPTRLRQVLVNLVGNAIKFTEKGAVTLSMRLVEGESDNPKMEFTVTDSGIGMTSQQLELLFLPFSQGDASTSRRFGGTGLGLTISKRIIDQLGGEIIVESEYGAGTVFRTIIPIGSLKGVKQAHLTAQSEPAYRSKASKAEPPSLDCRILLAEDGPDNQRLLTFVLTKAGAQVTLADNGQIAVDLMLASMREPGRRETDPQPFDVILMDMQMPVLDGYQAARRLREEGCQTPIIALTAHAMHGDREHCLAAGCSDYLTKPIDRHTLVATILRNLKKPQPAATA